MMKKYILALLLTIFFACGVSFASPPEKKLGRNKKELASKVSHENMMREAKQSEILAADAARISVKSIVKIGDDILSTAKFSQDGSYLFFSSSGRLKIIDIKTLNIVLDVEMDEILVNATWSPDNTKVAYSKRPRGFGGKMSLNILNVDSGKTFKLEYPGDGIHDQMFWFSESEIYFNARNYFSFNLDTLTKHPLIERHQVRLLSPFDKAGRQKQKHKMNEIKAKKANMQKLFSQNNHKKSYIYKGNYGITVGDKGGFFSRVLIDDYIYSFEISPNLRYIAFKKNGKGLYIAFLGQRDEPKMNYHVDINRGNQLNEKQKEEFKKYFNEDTIIYGNIYGPKINPLNDKIIGPDRNKFKGKVRFTELRDSSQIVKISLEVESIGIGDIITDIESDYLKHKAGYKLEFPSKIWSYLE